MGKNLKFTDFIYCYDLVLFNKFKDANIPYIMKARSVVNNKIFTMYEKTPLTIEIYKEYEAGKLG